MDVRFTVGEFAKLCGISKQALIFYDKEGIVRPKYKDPNNGYRYYSADQLEQMDSIMILREMGLSLSEIKDHMKNRSLQNSLQLLETQRSAIHEKIEKLLTIEHRIDLRTESLQLFCTQDKSFKIKTLPAQLLAATKVSAPQGLLEVDIALKKLLKQITASGSKHSYMMGDTVSMENLKKRDFLNFEYAFCPVESCDESIKTIEMPAGEYAVQCHFGPYTSMGETYGKMLDEIENRGKQLAGSSYEFCVLDSLTSASPENYCTVIQIKIE